MKNTILMLLILALINQVSAINDAYVRIDAMGTDLCIAKGDDLLNGACDNETYLQLPGDRDTVLYFTPSNNNLGNMTDNEQFVFFGTIPFNLVVNYIIPVILLLIFAVMVIYFIRIAGVII